MKLNTQVQRYTIFIFLIIFENYYKIKKEYLNCLKCYTIFFKYYEKHKIFFRRILEFQYFIFLEELSHKISNLFNIFELIYTKSYKIILGGIQILYVN